MPALNRSFPAAVAACLLSLILAGVAFGQSGTPIGSRDGFQPKSSLVSKGNSAGDPNAVENYVPKGAIVADSGFRPNVDGFAFENYGNESEPKNLGRAEMLALFGNVVCLGRSRGQSCKLTPAARAWMENQNEGMDGGHCQGFSVAALRMHADLLDQEPFGAAKTADLEIVGNRRLQASIAEHFTYQFLPPIVKKRVSGTPSSVLAKLGAALATGKELYTLGIYKPDFSGGHAITPFAIEDKGGGRFAILVYDNNFPGTTRAVNVDTTTETWDYVSGTNPSELGQVYKGDATSETLELDPTLPVEEYYSPCTFCKRGAKARTSGRSGTVLAAKDRYTEITLGGDPRNHPHLVFTDGKGRRTGVVGGRFLQEIPDVEVVKTYATRNWEGAPEPRFRIPEGKDYTITVDGSNLTKPTTTDVDLVGNGLVIEVDEIKMQPGQKDKMALPGGYGITYQSNGDDEEAPNFFAGLVEDGAAYNFAATAVGIKKGSTLSLLVEQKEKVVILDSTGSKGVLNGKGIFILQLTKAEASGRISQWQAGNVRLDGSKEEKAGFEYGSSPRRGKSLPILILDKDANEKRVISAKPQR